MLPWDALPGLQLFVSESLSVVFCNWKTCCWVENSRLTLPFKNIPFLCNSLNSWICSMLWVIIHLININVLCISLCNTFVCFPRLDLTDSCLPQSGWGGFVCADRITVVILLVRCNFKPSCLNSASVCTGLPFLAVPASDINLQHFVEELLHDKNRLSLRCRCDELEHRSTLKVRISD